MNDHRRYLFATVMLVVGVSAARAQVTYQWETLPPPAGGHEIFNNSQGTETEDCWVANAFQVIAGGTQMNSISLFLGQALTNQLVTATLYTGTSLTVPSGLTRIVASTNTVSVSGAANTLTTIPLATPINLSVGQIFYAAVLIRGVPGTLFPFSSDAGETPPITPLGHSFFDVGPTQGAAYNLDVTTNATVLGGTHPVVDGAQSAGNLGLRVNAVPEPSSLILAGLGVAFVARRWRRKQA
jgi:PEP-CTERM motif